MFLDLQLTSISEDFIQINLELVKEISKRELNMLTSPV